MVNVVVSSDNLTVLGGPERIDVDLNIGAAGSRGSIFFTGLQNPNSLTNQDFTQQPLLFDIYIVIDPSSENYLQAYQYLNRDGVLTWVPSFKISENVTAFNKVVSFASGVGSVILDVADLGLNNVTFESFTNSFAFFNVQATISNINIEEAPDGEELNHFPAALSINVGDAYFDNSGGGDPGEYPMKLPIEFKAAEFDGTAWSLIANKNVLMHLRVEFVDPNEVLSSLAGGSS
jgi:hypothetical protein